jgi:hypothetical protein
MKYSVADIPLYYQPPKCTLKTGFLKTGKTMYCDIVFNMDDEHFFAWLEQLEEFTRKTIFDNRDKWFDTELEMTDIENTLTSPYKMYKSGKCFIVRASIPTTLGNSDLKIYDEEENELSPDDLKENMQSMVILEFKGVKCMSRGFIFEIELKQMLIVKPVKLFEKCIIRDFTPQPKVKDLEPEPEELVKHKETPIKESIKDFDTNKDLANTDNPVDIPIIKPDLDKKTDTDSFEKESALVDLANNEPIEILDDFDNQVELLEAESEPLHLKNRQDVYYKMYKEARQKAREAKLVALTNYLESKRIKNEYFLENISEDDDSDLENLIHHEEEK